MSWIVGGALGAVTGLFSVFVLNLDFTQLRWWLFMGFVLSVYIIGHIRGGLLA